MTAPVAHSVTVKSAGTECSFETGKVARQASAAVVGRSGDNVVLATVVVAKEPKPGQSFFPLTVEYREKFAAVGRIPGNYFRREAKISDHEVLVSRLIDRTIRSLFPDEFKNEVQVQVQVLSAEPSSDVQSLALLTAACALHLSPAPCKGPAAGVRIARVRGQLVTFPNQTQLAQRDLEFAVGVSPDGPVMLEGEALQVPEEECLAAMAHALEVCRKFQAAFEELRQLAGRPKAELPQPQPLPTPPEPVLAALRQGLRTVEKQARRQAIDAARRSWLDALEEPLRPAAQESFEHSVWSELRELAMAERRRVDGRAPDQIRPIWSEVGFLPRAHGSSLFTRGETQAIVSCTLGSTEDGQRKDGYADDGKIERFLLHYNFPPYSVGEIRPLRGPGRREIGHGSLARRGLLAALPTAEAFPYTIRVESEITESNGSSSMATVCGGTMAMLAAGVPLSDNVAGIAMGLISDGSRHVVLSDILGDEDHLGDMDFKVVGTSRGVTAIQLDNKLGGLTLDLLGQALEQARAGRLHILGEMAKTIAAPAEPSRFVPRAMRTAILPDSIGALIGARGANIKAITEATGAKVSVDDHGQVLVYATEGHSARQAMLLVQRAAGVLKKGRCYRGTVTGVKDFGAFVRINAVNEGLVPVEELDDKPVVRASDIAREGEEMIVAVLGADDRGRLRLSRRQAKNVPEAQIEF